VGKHCSNPQCFKEKNNKTKFSISSILKKKLIEIILEKNITKKTQKTGEKKPCWKHNSNS
jgi:hypothetical protein